MKLQRNEKLLIKGREQRGLGLWGAGRLRGLPQPSTTASSDSAASPGTTRGKRGLEGCCRVLH